MRLISPTQHFTNILIANINRLCSQHRSMLIKLSFLDVSSLCFHITYEQPRLNWTFDILCNIPHSQLWMQHLNSSASSHISTSFHCKLENMWLNETGLIIDTIPHRQIYIKQPFLTISYLNWSGRGGAAGIYRAEYQHSPHNATSLTRFRI